MIIDYQKLAHVVGRSEAGLQAKLPRERGHLSVYQPGAWRRVTPEDKVGPAFTHGLLGVAPAGWRVMTGEEERWEVVEEPRLEADQYSARPEYARILWGDDWHTGAATGENIKVRRKQ